MIAMILAGLLAAPDSAPPVEVRYLPRQPVIDGVLEPWVETLPVQRFAQEYRFDNPDMPRPEIGYRLGYTEDYLYLAITTSATTVAYHDRGFLWGDGYRLLLALPNASGRSDEYADITVSPVPAGDKATEIRLHTLNNIQHFRKLGPATRAAEAAGASGTVFEALIAWDEIDPFHPLLRQELGFNLYFAKGFRTDAKGHFPYGYAVTPDEGIWDEELQTRAFVPLKFAPPTPGKPIVRANLMRRTLMQGESVRLQLATRSQSPSRQPLAISILDSSGRQVARATRSVATGASATRSTIAAATGPLAPGVYTVRLASSGWRNDTSLTILPRLDFEAIAHRIQRATHGLPQGTADTLIFHAGDIKARLAALKPYESGTEILSAWRVLETDLATARTGRDPFAGRRGPYRRGFRSAQDGSYQPYSFKLPADYRPDRRYPAIVFLHGSGSDEVGLLDRERASGDYIQIAPYGRDSYAAYASQQSQIDIAEALDAAAGAFPIDRERVVIGGFSMGGYGALLAFHANPKRYRGVAIFAGHPNLANAWLDTKDHPNFLDPAFLAPFAGVPVFIYHGDKDPSLPVELALKLAEALRQAKAEVTLSIAEGRGHTYQDERTQALYADWLQRIATRP